MEISTNTLKSCWLLVPVLFVTACLLLFNQSVNYKTALRCILNAATVDAWRTQDCSRHGLPQQERLGRPTWHDGTTNAAVDNDRELCCFVQALSMVAIVELVHMTDDGIVAHMYCETQQTTDYRQSSWNRLPML